MRYLWQHIKSILGTYDGSIPLTHFLKNYCRQYPILGSRDRRMLSTIIYSWYRCAHGLLYPTPANSNDVGFFENQIKECLAICNITPDNFARLFSDIPTLPFSFTFDASLLFPHDIALSVGISRDEWLQSMLTQPRLFIRVRKDADKISALLASKQIPYTFITPSCLSIPNGAPVDSLLPADSYVVQDASSQQTGIFFAPLAGEHWYDCCAGAGGKSLLLMDSGAKIKLTITDKRGSIISNLKDRFRLYNLPLPAAYIADAADSLQVAAATKGTLFDNIICDAPCSGSGTWARTPEQLHFFNASSIDQFSRTQKAIAINVAHNLKKGGKLIYITCSVFRQENEDVVDEIIKNTRLRVIKQQLINGTAMQADSMFVAVLE